MKDLHLVCILRALSHKDDMYNIILMAYEVIQNSDLQFLSKFIMLLPWKRYWCIYWSQCDFRLNIPHKENRSVTETLHPRGNNRHIS